MEPDEIESPELSQPVATTEPRRLWDKRADESQKAFDAFAAYRDAERRSFKSIADQLNCSPQNIWQWSSRFDWRGRCDAWDIEQDRLQRVAFARGRTRMKERHLQVAKTMLSIAAHGLVELKAKVEQKLPLHLSPEQIALLVKAATELERTTLGMDKDQQPPTQIAIWLGRHAYDDEEDEGGDEKWESLQDLERRQWEALSPEQQQAMSTWKDPPRTPRKLTN